MPRLTFNDYLKQRAFLRLAWEQFDQLYSLLTPDQQWALHRYYQPITDDTDEFLKRNRAGVTKQEPTLPARAGRLNAQLHRVYEASLVAASAHQSTPPKSRPRTRSTGAGLTQSRISVRGIVRPTPDLRKLARALAEMAKRAGEDGLSP
jgi:hypothetical protein